MAWWQVSVSSYPVTLYHYLGKASQADLAKLKFVPDEKKLDNDIPGK